VVDCNLPPPVLAGEAPLAGCGCADCPRACTLNLPQFKDFSYDFYIVQGVDGLVFIMIIGEDGIQLYQSNSVIFSLLEEKRH
jgi:hypothetical protein